MLSNETVVAVASAHKSTMLTSESMTQAALKYTLLCEMEDYFKFAPNEGSQFDAQAVLSELRAVPENGEGHRALLCLLGQIGFRTTPEEAELEANRTYVLDATVWGKCIDDLTASE